MPADLSSCVRNSSESGTSRTLGIFELLKNVWSGKEILSLARQKQVKTFFHETMTWFGGNGLSAIRKAPWCLCHRCVPDTMSEKIE